MYVSYNTKPFVMGKMMDNVMPNNLTQNANLMIKMNSRKF
jgi:hypothetical protein